MSGRQLFGTDGIRGRANVYPMTVEIALALGKSLAYMMRNDHGNCANKIVIGKDTRLSGYCFEQAIAAGICSMGTDVVLLGPMPTPAIAFFTKQMNAYAGVVVSASHNQFEDNGIKLFGPDGFKFPDETERKLESLIFDEKTLQSGTSTDHIGQAMRDDNLIEEYCEAIKSAVTPGLCFAGLKIAIDCANGAAYRVAPKIFRELGAEVHCIGISPNGRNINLQSGALHPENLQALVKKTGAHLGIAFDGDADRSVFVDENGDVVGGDAVIAVLAKDLHVQGKLKNNTVVTTVMSNYSLEQCLNRLGIAVLRTDVGDRYVVEQMRADSHSFGGEESGHLLFLDHSTTGDGLLSAVALVSVMLRTKVPLSELKSILNPVPRALVNRDVLQKVPLHNLLNSQKLIRDIEAELDGVGRTLIRYSGTEKKIRVLIEGSCQDRAYSLAEKIADQVAEDIVQYLIKFPVLN